MPAAHLRLDQRRDFRDLLGETLRTFGRHAPAFLGATLLVVVPAGILIDGVWGGVLREGGDAPIRIGPLTVWSIVTPPLVTALHVRIVERLGEGVAPTAWRATREAAARVPAAVLAMVLYSLAVVIGLALLIVPGVYLAVRFIFALPAAVFEGVGPVAALRSSAELTRGYWARAFLYSLGSALVLGLVPVIIGELLALALEGEGGAPAYHAVVLATQALYLSLTTLFGTLLYFDLRLRHAAPLVSATLVVVTDV